MSPSTEALIGFLVALLAALFATTLHLVLLPRIIDPLGWSLALIATHACLVVPGYIGGLCAFCDSEKPAPTGLNSPVIWVVISANLALGCALLFGWVLFGANASFSWYLLSMMWAVLIFVAVAQAISFKLWYNENRKRLSQSAVADKGQCLGMYIPVLQEEESTLVLDADEENSLPVHASVSQEEETVPMLDAEQESSLPVYTPVSDEEEDVPALDAHHEEEPPLSKTPQIESTN